MTLAGAMKNEKINLATRCVWQLLPQADTAGRPVLFFCPGRRNFAEYTVEQEMVSATHATSRFTDACLPIIDTLCTHAWYHLCTNPVVLLELLEDIYVHL